MSVSVKFLPPLSSLCDSPASPLTIDFFADLTPQLRDFSLRSLDFVMRRTGSSVPPITSAELQPFGVKVCPRLPAKLSLSACLVRHNPASKSPVLTSARGPADHCQSRRASAHDSTRFGHFCTCAVPVPGLDRVVPAATCAAAVQLSAAAQRVSWQCRHTLDCGPMAWVTGSVFAATRLKEISPSKQPRPATCNCSASRSPRKVLCKFFKTAIRTNTHVFATREIFWCI